ncbi:MAG TPA: hypothetical protein VFX16_02990 [Pseudonocardiaceae bacterium]|nr:hypothetical protein [Pseudonocardiaceae bacterium]
MTDNMLKRPTFKSMIAAVVMLGLAGLFTLLSPGAGSATTTGPGPATAHAMAAVPASPTTVRCTTPGHANPCWATTQDPNNEGVTMFNCPANSPVPLLLRAGGTRCIRSDELVEISCFFQGNPVVGGDNFQDHVIEDDAGGQAFVGHIPDFFINLGGKTPNNSGIPAC